MNQTDTKRILAIFVGVLHALCVNTCPKNQFQLPDSLCCSKCPRGMYVAKNCSREPSKLIGVVCNKCRRCEETGQITVSNCTMFSDTQCEMGPSAAPPQPIDNGKLPQIIMWGCSSVVVVVVVFMLAVIVTGCLTRIRKSGESGASSIGNPFKRHRESLKKILI